jgi:hypothetical protein
MTEKNIVPSPVLVNCLKHHLVFIRSFIASSATEDISLLPRQLYGIGESQMDLYTGSLSPGEIAFQIIEQLKNWQLFEKQAYISWLNRQESGYATLQLSDGSTWILRIGEQEERYIHIHPGRYAAHTIRVRATTLKTAIALSVWQLVHHKQEISLAIVNQVRKELLQVSPVKSISSTEAISKLLYLLNST